MKTLKLFTLVFCCFMYMNTSAQEEKLTAEQVPEQIKSYISTHFSGHKIYKAEKETKRHKTEYEIKLNKDVELEFNGDFAIKQIESHAELPDSVIPDKIKQYVQENYPDHEITEWKRKHLGQEIELNDDLELIFDKEGNFVALDD